MTNIFVDPSSAEDYESILVNGKCYKRVGPSQLTPDTLFIDEGFDSCEECLASPSPSPSPSPPPDPPGGQTQYWPLRTDYLNSIGSDPMVKVGSNNVNTFTTSDSVYGDVCDFALRFGTTQGFNMLSSASFGLTNTQKGNAWSLKVQFRPQESSSDPEANEYTGVITNLFQLDYVNQQAEVGPLFLGESNLNAYSYSWEFDEWYTAVFTSATGSIDFSLYLGKDAEGTINYIGDYNLGNNAYSLQTLARSDTRAGFQGYMKDCRFWLGTELTAAQAQQSMSADLT